MINNKKMRQIIVLVIIGVFTMIPLVEIFTYKGFILSHSKIDLRILAYLGLLFTTHVSVSLKRKTTEKLGMLYIISTLILFLTMIFLAVLELKYYPNFIFSKIHVVFTNTPLFLGYLLATGFIMLTAQSLFNVFRKKLIYFLIFTFLVSLFILDNTTTVTSTGVKFIPPALENPKASYSYKMEYLWSSPYGYLEIIENLTDDNSVIFLPTGTTAQAITGNNGMMRYFLYPRKRYLYDPEKSKDGFLIASPGNELGDGDYDAWPKIKIKSDYYFLINTNDKSVKIIFEDFDPAVFSKDIWGLIKI